MSTEDFEARVRALFAPGPDTAIRTVWRDGVEYVEVPMGDLREAFDPGAAESVNEQQARSMLAIMGSQLDAHINNTEYLLSRATSIPVKKELEQKLVVMHRARAIRDKEQPEVTEVQQRFGADHRALESEREQEGL